MTNHQITWRRPKLIYIKSQKLWKVQTAREYKGILRGNENILYLNYCGGYTHTRIYQTSTIYRINYIQQCN